MQILRQTDSPQPKSYRTLGPPVHPSPRPHPQPSPSTRPLGKCECFAYEAFFSLALLLPLPHNPHNQAAAATRLTEMN